MIKRILVTLAVVLTLSPALAGQIWYRAQDEDSVTIAPVCAPVIAGTTFADLDYDYSSLTITVVATGDGVAQTFTYTGGDIDDGPGDGTWGDPTTDAIEIDTITGSNCIEVSLRDEVLAVSGATEWAVYVSDGGNALMDYQAGEILALATSADNQADVQAVIGTNGLDHLVAQPVVATDVAAGSIIAKLCSKSATADYASCDNQTDSQEATADTLSAHDTTVTGDLSTLDTKIGTPTDTDISTDIQNLTDGDTPVQSNVKQINDCAITGDGNATPFDSGC